MKRLLFLLFVSMGIGRQILAEEFFPNGGFEEDSFSGLKIKYSCASIVKTTYGKSIYLGKPVGGIEAEVLSDAIFPGQEDSNWKSFPYCSFELNLTAKTQYELSFDYLAGNIRNGGEFAITDSKGNIIRKRTMTVTNLDWNHVSMPFQAGDDGTAIINFRIASQADLGGMTVDNVSVRILGDLLPRWGSGNILIGKGELPGWFWQINGNVVINCNGKGFAVKTSAKETVIANVKTPSVMPGREYCLRLGGKGNKTLQAIAELKMLDGAQRQIGEPLLFHLKSDADKQFINNWFFSVPPTTMLVELTVKYILDGETTASFDTPRIFVNTKRK